MFAEGWVVYARKCGSPELRVLCQVGSGDSRGLRYTTQSSANTLIFIIAYALQLIYKIN